LKFKTERLVAHAYNLSYLGGSNQEDCGLKPAQAAQDFVNPYLKKSFTKIELVVEWLKV
jgi:hypothetical protein